MKKVRFEDGDVNKIIEVCLKKVDGVFIGSWQDVALIFDNIYKPEALARFGKYISMYRDNLKEKEDSVESILELRKERRKLQSQRRELNRLINELADMEGLKEMVLETLSEYPNVPIFQKPLVYTPSNNEGILCLSDIHYGIGVDNEKNIYNPQICIESFEKVYKETVEYTQFYKLKKIHVLLGGDLISGLIHTNLRLQQLEDIISQIKNLSDILVKFLSNLREVNPYTEIVVHLTAGNHGRMMEDKKKSLSSENFEHLIAWHLETLGFNVNQGGDCILFNVAGHKIGALHGHQVAPAKAYSYIVGLKKVIPDAILMSHYHSDIRIDNGCPVIVNGSMVGTDEYALEGGWYSLPHQKLIIFNENNGEIATHKITFKRR